MHNRLPPPPSFKLLIISIHVIICNPSSPTQTVSQREKKAKLQEKRKAQMAARLEKVRQRKQLKPPEVEEKGEEEEEGKLVGGLVEGERREEDPLAAMIESELGKAREKAEKGGGDERDGGVAKKPYVRPWDKGKSEFKT